MVFSSKLIDAKFPDFSKVFSQTALPPLIIPKQQLRDALTRVAILANEKYKGVTFDIKAEWLKLSAHNPEHDSAEEELLIEYAGEPLNIIQFAIYAGCRYQSGLGYCGDYYFQQFQQLFYRRS